MTTKSTSEITPYSILPTDHVEPVDPEGTVEMDRVEAMVRLYLQLSTPYY